MKKVIVAILGILFFVTIYEIIDAIVNDKDYYGESDLWDMEDYY